jgi:transforming growth factor-beta-induced protein
MLSYLECRHVRIGTQKNPIRIHFSRHLGVFTMMFRLATAFLACLAATGVGAKKTRLSTSRQLQEQDPTIAELIFSTAGLETLSTAVTLAGLDQALSTETFTALAPTNDGFDDLDPTLLNLLLTPPWELHLVDLLEYHVADTPAFTFTLQNGSEITMLNGEIVRVGRTANPPGGDIYTFSNSEEEGATLITADIFAANGIVHIIDAVLKPSFFYRSVIDLSGQGTFNTITNLALLTGLDGALSDGTFTLFAPTDAAFNRLPAATIGFLTSPLGLDDLTELMLYHAVEAVIPTTLLVDGAGLPTSQGKSISISIAGDTIMVNNDATVIDADILALNGLTHGIDRVLMIPEDTPPSMPVDPIEDPYSFEPPSPNYSIYNLASTDPILSTLTITLDASGIAQALNNPAATFITAFGPINPAWSTLPDGLLDTLLTPPFKQHLYELALYHISDEVITSTDLFPGKIITMQNGETVTYSEDDQGLGFFNEAGIAISNVRASNGAAFLLTGVLEPSFFFRTVIDLEGGFSTLLSLVAVAELEATLRGGAWTLFAPTNAAFDKLDQATLGFLTSAAGKNDLIEILQYHVVSYVLTSDNLTNGAMATTAQGSMVTISIEDSQVKVNDATIINTDILAINGVTHGIDTVLLPAADNPVPTMAPMSAGAALGTSFLGLFVMVLAVAF